MTLGDTIEIKIYGHADGPAKGQPRSTTIADLRNLFEGSTDTDVIDALTRLESSGFVNLDKWVDRENRFVSCGEFSDKRNFFYGPPFGPFRIAVTATGRQDFEHRSESLSRPRSSKNAASEPVAGAPERWKIMESLSEGGQGRIFLVSDTSKQIQETCVLKRLKNVSSEDRRARFSREVAAIQRINHLNVLRVYDTNLTLAQPYFVGEYCEGGSLEKRGPAGFKGNIRATIDTVIPVLDALLAAHATGVIHRDIKPANLLFRADGTPVVADFGICHMEDGEHVTLSDEGVGSRNYIAPEMESGQHHLGNPTDQTDVYSLGKVIYWMLSGGKIFAREDHRSASLANLLNDQRFEHVHMFLDQVVVREPGKRIHSHELKERLKMTATLVDGNYAPLAPSIGIRCRFCGIGKYTRYANESGRSIPSLGLSPATPGGEVRALRCNHCGHVELFQFSGIENPAWWEK